MANETDSISNKTPEAPQENTDAGPSQQQIWAQTTTALEKQWHTNCEDGLTTQEAKTRFNQQGPNELQAKKPSNLLRFLKQFNSSIIYILAAAAIITFLLHRYSDSIVIGLVIDPLKQMKVCRFGYCLEMRDGSITKNYASTA